MLPVDVLQIILCNAHSYNEKVPDCKVPLHLRSPCCASPGFSFSSMPEQQTWIIDVMHPVCAHPYGLLECGSSTKTLPNQTLPHETYVPLSRPGVPTALTPQNQCTLKIQRSTYHANGSKKSTHKVVTCKLAVELPDIHTDMCGKQKTKLPCISWHSVHSEYLYICILTREYTKLLAILLCVCVWW